MSASDVSEVQQTHIRRLRSPHRAGARRRSARAALSLPRKRAIVSARDEGICVVAALRVVRAGKIAAGHAPSEARRGAITWDALQRLQPRNRRRIALCAASSPPR